VPGRRAARAAIAGALLLTGLLHAITPVGPSGWHWLHLMAQKLYLAPIIMAGALLGPSGAFVATAAASALFAVHIILDWRGFEMVQAGQVAEIANFWIVGAVAAILFRHEREAREATRVAHEETLAALAGSLELRENYTAGHSRRVRGYALVIAEEMGLRDPAFLANLAQGALLHDVGKIGIPDRILLKPGPLGEEERSTMRRHPQMGASLVGEIAWLRPARALILAHHERYDGAGYPQGLAGATIPLAARIFTVADAFDALTTDRPYHEALSWEEAALKIKDGSGTQFDPDACVAFLRIPYHAWAHVAAGTGVTLRRGAPGAALDVRNAGGELANPGLAQ